MRKIITTTFLSMDGVLQAPGAPEEDRTNGFNWGGWIAAHFDDKMNESMGASMSQPFDLLLGRFTYDIFDAHWPYQEGPIAEKFNSIHKFVVSSQPQKLSWANSSLITGDVVKGLQQLKAQPGRDLLVFGSSKLIQTLLANGLVDEIRTWTFPVTIGKGKRLFAEGTQPGNWKVTDAKVSTTGVVMAVYTPAGEIKLGPVESVTPSEAELERRKRVAEQG